MTEASNMGRNHHLTADLYILPQQELKQKYIYRDIYQSFLDDVQECVLMLPFVHCTLRVPGEATVQEVLHANQCKRPF